MKILTENEKHDALVALMNGAAILKDPEGFSNLARLTAGASLLRLHTLIEEMDTESDAVLNMFSQADTEPNQADRELITN